MLDSFGDGFMAFDFDWRITHCNRGGAAHYGLNREQLVGRIAWDVPGLGEDSSMREFLERAARSRASVEAEVPSELRSGHWFHLRAFPLEGGLGVSSRDVTERRERRLREREQSERLELALATSGFGDWRYDVASNLIDFSTRAAEMAGVTAGPHLTPAELLAGIHPDDRELARLTTQKAMQSSAAYEIECRIARPTDGAERWLMIRARAQLGDDGQPVGILGVLMDVTDAKAADARIRADRVRLAELERRRAYLLEIADTLRALTDPEEILTTASRMMTDRMGVSRMGYAEVDEDDMFHVRGEWTVSGPTSLAGRSFDLSSFGPTLLEDLRHGLDLAVDDITADPRTASRADTFARVAIRAMIVVPLVRDGRLDAVFYAHEVKPRAWSQEDVALMEDVASRTWSALSRARVERKAGERQRLLINELNHRVKNTLATIQSLAHQTLRDTVPIRDARDRLTERLLALSTAHNVLTRQNWEGADLQEIAREAVRPYDDPPGARIDISGAQALLAPNVALALSMALHELATNAVKYGALSSPVGRVTIAWTLNPNGDAIDLQWREAGGPPVRPPEAKGFGSRLISSLTGEFGAPAALDYAPDGVTCRLRAPVV